MKTVIIGLFLLCAFSQLPAETTRQAGAEDILGKSIRAIENARTLHYEAVRTDPRGLITQSYYLWRDGGVLHIRVDSSAAIPGKGITITTRFIKDKDGIWEVWPDQLLEVSSAFTDDQFLGVYPFFRLLLTGQHPYALSLSEQTLDGEDCFVISGELSAPPNGEGPNIAKDFTYKMEKKTGRLVSLHEVTFGHASLDLRFSRFELNSPLDPGLFVLPSGVKTTVVRSSKEYARLRIPEVSKRVADGPGSASQAQFQAGRPSQSLARLAVLSFAIVMPLIGLFLGLRKNKGTKK